MRPVLIGLAVVVAVLATHIRPGSAQYNARWCTDGEGTEESGEPQCAYNTLQQCREAASGRGMHCMQNPDYLRRERDSDRRRPVRRRND
jgi:hypothetical protein